MRLELPPVNLIHPFMVVGMGIQNVVVIHSNHDRHLHQQNGLKHTTGQDRLPLRNVGHTLYSNNTGMRDKLC